MARKNPKRRLIAKIKAWDQQAREMTRDANADATVMDVHTRTSWNYHGKGHVAHTSRWLVNARQNARKPK